jgi:hypothetical protein
MNKEFLKLAILINSMFVYDQGRAAETPTAGPVKTVGRAALRSWQCHRG